jgi:peroxiredoxin Q/BCP
MFASLFRMAILSLFLGLLLASQSRANDKKIELNVGDKAPAFEARTDAHATWDSAERFGKKWVVVYFYPGDFTPGCTAQAKAFRDAMHKLTEMGVEVVGISGDSVETHSLFKKAQKLNFTLLADEEGAIAKLFGVPVGKGGKVRAKDGEGKPIEITRNVTAARWTFVIGKDGRIVYKNVKVTPALDAKAITEFIAKAESK